MRERYCLAIVKHLGIMPWQQHELLTVNEFLACVEFVDEANRRAAERN